ncbi:MAG TPA: DMT family transporter [Baekduia sp.]|nr:DMT family transporter [Baekduia sp.]
MTLRGWALFATVSVLWGIPYLFIKIALDEGIPPLFVAWSRGVLAAILLLSLAWLSDRGLHSRGVAPRECPRSTGSGVLKDLPGNWRWLFAYAVAELTIPFPLIAFGQQYVDSSVAAIMIASSPLMVALLVVRFEPSDRVNARRMVGLVLGLAGVAALVGIDVSGTTDELLGAGALLIAALGYSIGPVLLSRKLTHIDPRAAMGAASAISVLILTPAMFFVSMPSISAKAGGSLLVLGLVCTSGGLLSYMTLLKLVGPTRASVASYVNPVVAVTLGVIVLEERPGIGTFVGLVLILTGCWLATRGRPPARPQGRAVATE